LSSDLNSDRLLARQSDLGREFHNLGATTLNDLVPWKRGDTEGRREGENQRTAMNEVENREGTDCEDS